MTTISTSSKSAAGPYGREPNQVALERIVTARPILRDILPAVEVVPGMEPNLILTSGAGLPWSDYSGGQRRAIVGGAMFEGLASDKADAEAKLMNGEIAVGACQDYGCIGSLAGIYTASMPVFVVENPQFGNLAYCNCFEGSSPRRLNYGVYDNEVDAALQFLHRVVTPVLAATLKRFPDGIPLQPLMRRALNMGDELHSRNTAATLLFTREILPSLLEVYREMPSETRTVVDFITSNDYFFLRLSMAAAKATADAAAGVDGSSIVTAMAFSCREFAIRVSGTGNEWFRAPIPDAKAKYFPGHSESEAEYMGGESPIIETIGLGGFAQAAAFPLQDYQGGSPAEMIKANEKMYEITVGEHPTFRIPALGFRGVPVGIDVRLVVETGVAPVMDIGIAGSEGGQIGAGVLQAPLDCFKAAVRALDQ